MDSAFVAAKTHLEVPTRTECPRPALPSSDEDKPVIELASLNENLVTKHEVPERGRQRRRRLLEHIDDDAIVATDSSTLATCLQHAAPDGTWVAYTSNESGRVEVYVQSFPGPGGKRQISSAGGTQPRWRPDGRELFHVASDEHLTAVPIAVGADGQLEAGAPVPLFPTRISPYYMTLMPASR